MGDAPTGQRPPNLADRRLGEELQLLRAMLSVCAWRERVRADDERWMLPDPYRAKHGD